jgi:hypothetical protein
MMNNKPVSGLLNYAEVLKDIIYGSPVYLLGKAGFVEFVHYS